MKPALAAAAAVLACAAAGAACAGPPAPDATLCRDVIQRVCLGPRCGVVDAQLDAGAECDAALNARTGCGSDDFSFADGGMSRDRFLTCRVPLLRNGQSRLVAPGCDNVAEMFTGCPDLVRFLGGTP